MIATEALTLIKNKMNQYMDLVSKDPYNDNNVKCLQTLISEFTRMNIKLMPYITVDETQIPEELEEKS